LAGNFTIILISYRVQIPFHLPVVKS